MNETLHDNDLKQIEHLDFEPPCQARPHYTGAWGHVPEQPARWLVEAPCGASKMMCDGWVLSWVADPIALDCQPGCGGYHPYSEVRRIPL